jgi:ubiquinone biosynthesis monooxygenase Coq6
MINAAFRLPEVSMRYLNQLILEAQESKTPLVPSEIQQEISWRERSHDISPNSAYSSTRESNRGVPPADSSKIPPLVDSIQPGTIASFPLRLSHTESYIGEGAGSRTVLVGDAAHTVHPLAGQGLNLGIADVAVLSDRITEAVKLGQDCGRRLLSLRCETLFYRKS